MASSITASVTSFFNSLSPSMKSFWQLGVSKELVFTILLVLVVLGLARLHAARTRAQEDMSFEEKRRAIVSFRNGLTLIALGLLALTWAGEIRGILLSVTALVTGIILVSKEIISNFLGGLVFTFTKLAKIGDLIEINGQKGELIDHRWLYLTLMETSESRYYTGNTLRIPNSALITGSLRNYSLGSHYRFETLGFHTRPEHAAEARKIALEAAEEVCSVWFNKDKPRMIQTHSDSPLFEAPDASPVASIVSKTQDCVEILLRFPSPSERRALARQDVSDLYYTRMSLMLEQKELKKAVSSAEATRQAALSATPVTPPAAPTTVETSTPPAPVSSSLAASVLQKPSDSPQGPTLPAGALQLAESIPAPSVTPAISVPPLHTLMTRTHHQAHQEHKDHQTLADQNALAVSLPHVPYTDESSRELPSQGSIAISQSLPLSSSVLASHDTDHSDAQISEPSVTDVLEEGSSSAPTAQSLAEYPASISLTDVLQENSRPAPSKKEAG